MNIRPKKIVLTDRLLRSWSRCSRKAWLDIYGDQEKRIWTAHRTLQLDHQNRSFQSLIKIKPQRGVQACSDGALAVTGLRLKGFTPSNQPISSHPSLLYKVKGESKWGKFAYRPVIARQGKKVTREHRLSLAISGFLLEKFQQSPVFKGLVISLTKNGLESEEITLKGKLNSQLFDSLEKLNKDLQYSEPPPLIADRRKCSLCSWRGICNQDSKEEGNLSEISGIGPKRKEILQKIGILNINELSNFKEDILKEELIKCGEKNYDIASQIINQAKAQFNFSKHSLNTKVTLPELFSAPGVLLYDIESDPDQNHDFLHGFIAIYKENPNWALNKAVYKPILNIDNLDTNNCHIKLNKFLSNYKNWPVLHYGETEKITIMKIIKNKGIGYRNLLTLSNNFIDIHSRLKGKWLLPLNSYSLKSVATWAGFEWRNKGADGARALLWWRCFKESKSQERKQKKLDLIMEYNEDDCLATWHVAKWLLEND